MIKLILNIKEIIMLMKNEEDKLKSEVKIIK